MYVYADNAATTAMSPAALAATTEAMVACYGNPSSLHSIGQQAAERLAEARAVMAAGLNAKPQEIYFTSGGSEADNQAIVSEALQGAKKAAGILSPQRWSIMLCSIA